MSFTTEDLLRYLRIALQWAAAALVTHGVGSSGLWEPIIGVVIGIVTFLWTMYGNRIQAKVNEVAGITITDNTTGKTVPLVASMKVNDSTVAAAAPAAVTTAPNAVK